MEDLKNIKTMITEYVKQELQSHTIDEINTCELGQAIDMIKDLAEAIHYCAETEEIHMKMKATQPMK